MSGQDDHLAGQILILLVVLTKHLSNQKKISLHYVTREQATFPLNFFVCYANMFKLVQVSMTGEKKDITKIFLASQHERQ